MLLRNRSVGFTIVELLIVIVVIAILVTIITITFGNIRKQATNTKIVSNVKSYVTILQAYSATNDNGYPPIPGETHTSVSMVCLGIGYKDGKCGRVTGVDVYESTAFMNQLKSITYNKDPVNFDPGTVATEQFVGAVYGIDQVGPPAPHTGWGRVIEWFLIGENQKCGVPGAYSYATDNGNTACELFLEAV